jgi:L-amino acid N-acyltransferase YncA
MNIRDAVAADLPAIVAIYNATIPCQMVTADLEPVSVASRLAWFHQHTPDRRPLWVIESEIESGAEIVGWLGFQSFYGRPAYGGTVELSLYVSSAHRRQGYGRSLLERAIARSPELGLKVLLGFVFSQNQPSLRLFEQLGFQQWGYLPQVAELGQSHRDLVILGRPV